MRWPGLCALRFILQALYGRPSTSGIVRPRWLDALSLPDLDSDFVEAVPERAEDQDRPRLQSPFDRGRRRTVGLAHQAGAPAKRCHLARPRCSLAPAATDYPEYWCRRSLL